RFSAVSDLENPHQSWRSLWMSGGECWQVSERTGKRRIAQKWRKTLECVRKCRVRMLPRLGQALKPCSRAVPGDFLPRESTSIVEKPVDEWRTALASV
ncbi:hypothetical protein ABVT11_16480, partial [Uliginosibacterium paludis]